MDKVFTKEYLKEELDLPWNESLVLKDDIVDTSRWSEIHDLVFKEPKSGKIYLTSYSQGLTESQDERPWEYENEVTCYEVELKEVTVSKYVRVSK
jgi:hypothetical protein